MLLVVLLTLAEAACGGGSGSNSNSSSTTTTNSDPPPPPQGDIPRIGHVALVVFENEKEDAILGNKFMPYLSGLANSNAYASQYYANVHPSLGNYFMLTTGDLITNDLNFNKTVDQDNLVREIIKAGKTWKAYQESIPSIGYLGDGPYPYVKTHNPAAYFSDVRNDPAQAANMVGLDELDADLASGNLPSFMFIEPNQINTMHDCPGGGVNCDNDTRLGGGDLWASQHMPAIINNPAFQQDGLLIITFDESWDTDSQNGGGHVLTIFVGPRVRKQFVSTTFYQHQSILRTICDTVGVSCMGAATTAPPMAEFFTSTQP
ncbi:MAG: alkaline phosphatase family protein [Terriglobales bacterium]